MLKMLGKTSRNLVIFGELLDGRARRLMKISMLSPSFVRQHVKNYEWSASTHSSHHHSHQLQH